MASITRRALTLCTLVLFGAMTWPLAGQSLAQDTAAGKRDEKAMAVLQAMSDYLGKAPTLSFRAHTFFDVVQESGIKIKMARQLELSLKRPNQIQAEMLDDAGNAGSVWYDGSKLTVWRRSDNEFMTLELAADTDKLLDELTDKYEFQIPIADILYSQVSKALGENLMSSEYIGMRTVDGVQCHLVSFESEGADWQMWIQADSTPVPRRFVIDYVTAEHQPQFMAQLDAWSVGGEIDSSQFTAVVPDSVKKVEFGKASDAQR
jgi:hypothetical protein